MAQPYDETLSFTALMIISKKIFQFLFTSIITTHSNINTSDIFIIFYNITFNLQEHSATNLSFIASVKNL